MPEFCTCGAQLPPDALFCHKCGRPQRDIEVEQDVAVPEPVAVVLPVPAPQSQEAPVDFRNRVAVRIALLVAISATALSFLPFINWLAGGFFAVFFYQRRTGFRLNVGAGVRIGWITGLLAFALAAVVFTAEQLPAVLSGHLATTLQEQMKSFPSHDPQLTQQVIQFVQTGPGIAAVLFFSLAALFLFATLLSMAGGALGAKLVGSRD